MADNQPKPAPSRTDAQGDCICAVCPSYIACDELVAYCLSDAGRSKCIAAEVACMCPDCPVQSKMGYFAQFYCTRGNAQEQSGK